MITQGAAEEEGSVSPGEVSKMRGSRAFNLFDLTQVRVRVRVRARVRVRVRVRVRARVSSQP